MSTLRTWRGAIGGLIVVALATILVALAGCTTGQTPPAPGGKDTSAPAEEPAAQQEEPKPTSWVVYINDDDSYSQGGVTYKIALNLSATNPTADPTGKYTGNATASTSTEGNVGGAQLSAQAIAQSGTLLFTLEDPSAGGKLGPLNEKQLPDLSGRGTVTMKAAGSASVGPASGSFSNTSTQKIDVQTNGSKVTLSVVIQGHKYTFNGTISGK